MRSTFESMSAAVRNEYTAQLAEHVERMCLSLTGQ